MVSEINLLPLPPGSVLNVKCGYEISSPTTQHAIEDLEQDPTAHSKLREGVWQRQQHLCYLLDMQLNYNSTKTNKQTIQTH